MAKSQTRRTVSLSHPVMDAAREAAAKDGIAVSEWLTRLIRQAIPDLPPTLHGEAAREAFRKRAAECGRKSGGVKKTFKKQQPPPPKPPSPIERYREVLKRQEEQAQLDEIARAKRPPREGDPAPAGSFCAVCTNAPGAVLAPLGRNNALVPVCTTCEEEPSNSGRYSFSGGRATDVGGSGHRHNGKWERR